MNNVKYPKVGLIGLGNMGGRMAKRMLAHGVDLVGYDADINKVTALGVTVANSIADLVARSEVILLSLPNSKIIEAVSYGPDGIVANVRAGQIVVDLSTAQCSSTRKLYEEYHKKGVELVDAGISGSAAAVEKGASTIMAGGSEAALNAVKPVLETWSKHIYYMGPSGTGHATKVLNNFLSCAQRVATAEVMVVAKKMGLHLETFLEVVNNSSGMNWQTVNRFPNIIRGDYMEGGLTNRLTAKDISLYIELTKEMSTLSLLSANCLTAYEIMIGLGHGDGNNNRLVDVLADLSGCPHLHE